MRLVKFEKAFAEDLEFLDEEPELKAKYEDLKSKAAERPMSESAQRGMVLFSGKANCAACHAGANFTDEQYHNLGVGMEAKEPDLGRYDVTKAGKGSRCLQDADACVTLRSRRRTCTMAAKRLWKKSSSGTTRAATRIHGSATR